MNYIREINAFIDWLETNPLEASTQTLWFHLMGIANKSGWPEWFTVANLTLQAKVGVTENTLLKHRNFLIQKGRIEYRNQGKQKAGKYHFIEFTSNIEVNREVKYEVNREVNPAVKGDPLFKLNETKLNSVIDSEIDNLVYESFYAAHTRIYGFQCNPFQAEQLGAFIDKDGMEEAVIVRALERAATKKAAHNFKYILGILSGYLKSKCLTLSAAIVQDEEFERNAAENNLRNKGQPDQETILQLYHRKIGQTSFDTKNMIIGWVDHYGEEWVKNAIEWAYNSNKRESIEVSTILKLWKKSNLNEPWSRKVI